jgi:hypothetical protein
LAAVCVGKSLTTLFGLVNKEVSTIALGPSAARAVLRHCRSRPTIHFSAGPVMRVSACPAFDPSCQSAPVPKLTAGARTILATLDQDASRTRWLDNSGSDSMFRRRLTTFVLPGVAAALLASCSPPHGGLRGLPVDIERLDCRQAMLRSTLIVTGRISHISRDSRVVAVGKDDVPLVRRQVTVEDVQVLKGRHDGAALEYVMYNYKPGAVPNGSFEWCSEGDRRIFFLRESGPVIRAVTDRFPSSLLLRTDAEVSIGAPGLLPETLARLLVMPSGAVGASALTYFGTNLNEALGCASYSVCDRLTRSLLERSDAAARQPICLARAEFFLADDGCLDTGEIESPFQKAQQRRQLIRAQAADAHRKMLESPLVRRVCVEPQSPAGVRDCLEFFSLHSDAVIRDSAQAELRRLSSVAR